MDKKVIEILDGYDLETKLESIISLVEDEEVKSRNLCDEFKKEDNLSGEICERDSVKHNYILRTLLNAINEDFTELKEEISQK
ncbi:hypothetical protein [Staphylococcus equorum]|uniref:hypothetical protein n=1 Tax=Staphylococcus equorum TaxID=246432 RepID=UPI0037D9C8D2